MSERERERGGRKGGIRKEGGREREGKEERARGGGRGISCASIMVHLKI